MAKVIEATDTSAAWTTMTMLTAAKVFGYGAFAGLVAVLLSYGFERLVFSPVLCRDSVAIASCASAPAFGYGSALLLSSLIGLVMLVRERVYRPLMAVIGVAASLWGFGVFAATMPFILFALVAIVIFGVAYSLFVWLVQPTNLLVSVSGVLIAVILARLALS